VFEFRKAIGEGNKAKANQIATYFAQNQKENPMVLVNGQVFSFFSALLQYHGLKDKSPANVAKVLRVSPFFVNDYIGAAKNYPMRKVSGIVAILRDIDVKSKGVGAANLEDADLYKEMLTGIFS
jgi:DNA polymerase-3 subunit delta